MVNRYLEVMAGSVATFAATNIDDAFLLTFFFARRVPPRRIVAGQFLGFAVIIVVSVTVAFAALAIPHRWIRFLGLFPLALGIRHFFKTRNPQPESKNSGSFGLVSIALITATNGADNIGVYVPFFVVARAHLWLILIAYAVLVGVWCWFGRWLGSRPLVLGLFERWGDRLVAAVFILLGISIFFLST